MTIETTGDRLAKALTELAKMDGQSAFEETPDHLFHWIAEFAKEKNLGYQRGPCEEIDGNFDISIFINGRHYFFGYNRSSNSYSLRRWQNIYPVDLILDTTFENMLHKLANDLTTETLKIRVNPKFWQS